MNKFSQSLIPNNGLDQDVSLDAVAAQNVPGAEVEQTTDDPRAIVEAVARLRAILDAPPGMFTHEAVGAARLRVRDLALRLHAANYWTNRSNELRDTTQILWETDRFLSDSALGCCASSPIDDR